MESNPMFKRRHYGTPQSTLLIITNFIVFATVTTIFASSCTVSSFFWICMGLLALYNYFNIRKDREEYTKARIIAYVISIVGMIAVFIVMRYASQNC
jgi:uncharacterized membrane protein HdeD (DUF308 family)